MKRSIAFALSLILVLCLLPMPAHAGGGAAGLYWESSPYNTADCSLDDWTAVNANGDSFVFGREGNTDEPYYSTDVQIGEDSMENLKCSDDYLISPPIWLEPGREYTLNAKVGAWFPSGDYGVDYEVYVYTGKANLKAENLYSFLGERSVQGWLSSRSWLEADTADLSSYAGQTIRLVFRHAQNGSSVFRLQDVRIYWQNPDELLGKVTAENVPMPQLGVNVKNLKESDIRFPDYANYTLVPGSLTYYKIVNEQGVKMVNEVFTGTGEYNVEFRVKPKAGVTVCDTGCASMNGLQAHFYPQSDGTVKVAYYPNRRLAPSTEIRDVDLVLDWPYETGNPDRLPDRWLADGTEDYHYAVTGVDWAIAGVFDPKGNWPDESPYILGADDCFERGVSYEARIRLTLDPGWTFSPFVHVTVNGACCQLRMDNKGWMVQVKYTGTPNQYEVPPVVTFHANGHGTAPLPIRVPYGLSLNEALGNGIWMNDADGKVFYGWSDSSVGGRDDLFSWTNRVIQEDTDLYAVWVDPVDAVTVYVDPPAAQTQGSAKSAAAVERYSYLKAYPDVWYTDKACESPVSGKLQSGKTYYSRVWVEPGEYQIFANDTKITVKGAKFVDCECLSEDLVVCFSVTIPKSGTVKNAALFVDGAVAYAPQSMAPIRSCLTPGVAMQTDDWWDSLDRAGNADCVWAGNFEPGRSYYTVVYLSPEQGMTLASDLQISAEGAEVSRVTRNPDGSYSAVLRVPVKSAYFFTMVSEGMGKFYFSAEHGTSSRMDFAAVRQGKYTLKAYPQKGWAFAGWYDGDKLISQENPCTINLKKNFNNGKALFVKQVAGAVDRVEISADVPKAGTSMPFTDHMAKAKITNSAAVSLEADRWYHDYGLGDDPMNFEGKRKYYIEVELKADAGRSLAPYTKVIVNGVYTTWWQQLNVSLWGAVSKDYVINPFTDVSESKYYYDAVMWAVSRDPAITGGTSATTFGPAKECTREQIVTFLWKANNAPEPSSTSCAFTDVNPSKYYYKAVLWAVENKITGGLSKTVFGVGKSCTRAQVVTFLYAAAGKPDPGLVSSPFTDVKPTDYYYRAVLWAVENGITGGVTATTFGPKKTCTRAQIVTFLYAAYGE